MGQDPGKPLLNRLIRSVTANPNNEPHLTSKSIDGSMADTHLDNSPNLRTFHLTFLSNSHIALTTTYASV
ncbi:hypothetical protein PCANC_03054 [Puccinia coronata f. sp. avenae]|uniref:Uncharacterized protein n=1 Tax=Puccinia coronata f. sp. avenae TaxID=200324 RepID=A0A2N5W4S7_9BASI|nr:hypothetical protein PCANC_03054 [Puccinia coronata f. sp. avenae]